MVQRRFGGPEGKVAFHKEMKATHEERKKADKKADKKDDKKATTPTAAQLATAAGRRSNKRAQRLATGAAKTGTKVKFGVGSDKTVNGQANVTKDQLVKAGFPTNTKGLREYMNAWNRTGKRPTKATATPTKAAVKPTTVARRGNANAVPGRRGVKPPTVKAPIHTALKRRITKPTESRATYDARRMKERLAREKARKEDTRVAYDAGRKKQRLAIEEAKAKQLRDAQATTTPPLNAAEAREEAKAKRLRDAAATKRATTERIQAGRKRIADAGADGPSRRGILSQPQQHPKEEDKSIISETIEKYLGPTAGGRAATVAGAVAGGGAGAGVVKGITALVKKLGRIPTMAEVKALAQGNITRGEFRGGETFKKGGLVKKSAAKKPSRKKSIDGIARRGKTRAKHR